MKSLKSLLCGTAMCAAGAAHAVDLEVTVWYSHMTLPTMFRVLF